MQTFQDIGNRETGHDSITIDEAPVWVRAREVDYSFKPAQHAPVTILLDDWQAHVTSNERYHRLVRRLETLQAVESLAQWQLPFDPGTQHIVMHSLRIHRPGFDADFARRERVTVLRRETDLERLTITGEATLLVVLEEIKPGDILDESYTIRTIPRILPEKHHALFAPALFIPVAAFRTSIIVPRGRDTIWRSSADSLYPTVVSLDDGEVWEWSRENLQATKVEPGTPEGAIDVCWIQTADPLTWEEVGRGVLEAWGGYREFTELAECVDTHRNTHDGSLERTADALIRFVQDEIRYLSVNTEFGGTIPSSPPVVLKRGFGDCKDKAFLLAHLLRGLGIVASPVLVHTRQGFPAAKMLPGMAAFNHVIVQYELGDQIRFVDPTVIGQGGGAFNRVIRPYEYGLVLSEIASFREWIANPSERGRYRLEEVYLIDSIPRRESLAEVTLVLEGSHADAFRARLIREGHEAVAESRVQMYTTIGRNCVRADPMRVSDDREKNQLTVKDAFLAEIDIPPRPDRPGFGTLVLRSHLLQQLLVRPHGERRIYPFQFVEAGDYEHSFEIRSPSMSREDPQNHTVRNNAFRFQMDVRSSVGVFSMSHKLRVSSDRIAAVDWRKFCLDCDEVFRALEWLVLFPLNVARPLRPRHRTPEPDRNTEADRSDARPEAGVPDSQSNGVTSEFALLDRHQESGTHPKSRTVISEPTGGAHRRSSHRSKRRKRRWPSWNSFFRSIFQNKWQAIIAGIIVATIVTLFLLFDTKASHPPGVIAPSTPMSSQSPVPEHDRDPNSLSPKFETIPGGR